MKYTVRNMYYQHIFLIGNIVIQETWLVVKIFSNQGDRQRRGYWLAGNDIYHVSQFSVTYEFHINLSNDNVVISCNCRMEILHGLVETHLCIALDISLILKGVVHFNQAHLFPKASIVSFYSKIQKMAVDHGLILIAFEISIQFV